jgi:hypothetical protein
VARLTDQPAINARPHPVTDYAPDPRGWSTFARLSSVLHRGIAGTHAPPVIGRVARWSGWATTPQRMTGLDGLSAGRQRPIVGRNSDLSDEKTAAADDQALRIFAERMTRR